MQHVEELQDYSRPEPNRSHGAKAFALLVLCCAFLVAWRSLGHGPESALASAGWTSDWDAAVQQSKATGKPALILFTADWCPACRQFESETLADSDVQKFLRDTHTLVMVDLTDRNGPNTARAAEFGVKAIPTLILYDQAGKEKARAFGMPTDLFMTWLKSGGTAVKFN
jgi:thiol:disulfide interchange protein DsbD